MFKPGQIIEFESGYAKVKYVVLGITRWEKAVRTFKDVRDYIELRCESGDTRKGLEALCIVLEGRPPKGSMRAFANVYFVPAIFANSATKLNAIKDALSKAAGAEQT